jgi:hypothetical protein
VFIRGQEFFFSSIVISELTFEARHKSSHNRTNWKPPLALRVHGEIMPIRFRCAYCNQLMGIARRKAGTVVRCPSCSGQVVVPNPTADVTEKPHEGASPRPAGAPELFERSNFDELFDDAAGGKRRPSSNPLPASERGQGERLAAAAAPRPTPDQPQAIGAAPTPKPVDFAFDVEPVPLSEKEAPPMPQAVQPGIVLSPRTATLLIVAVILSLSLAFIVGMIVGSKLLGSPGTSPSVEEVVPPGMIMMTMSL